MENPYAPPKKIDDAVLPEHVANDLVGLRREGNFVVCADNAEWPDRCAVCNQAVSGRKMTRKLFWHPGWIYLLFLVSWILYLIVALIVRKKGTIHISVCERHRKRRVMGILIASIGSLMCLLLAIIGALMTDSGSPVSGAIVLIGILGIVTCLITGALMIRVVTPIKIADNTLWIKAGNAFTDSI
ncbi:MAG: hypothetical protein JXR76_09085 [Deltaproteobacteria bacterium]|nr:hypothetical protein [Deltaproteobacteria bacterium]